MKTYSFLICGYNIKNMQGFITSDLGSGSEISEALDTAYLNICDRLKQKYDLDIDYMFMSDYREAEDLEKPIGFAFFNMKKDDIELLEKVGVL